MNQNVLDGLKAYKERYNKLIEGGKTPAEAREGARTNNRKPRTKPKTKRGYGKYKYNDEELYDNFIKVQNSLLHCREKRRAAIDQLEKCEEEERELTNLSRQIDRREKNKKVVMGPKLVEGKNTKPIEFKIIDKKHIPKSEITNKNLGEIMDRINEISNYERTIGRKATKEEEKEFEYLSEYLDEFNDNRRKKVAAKKGTTKKQIPIKKKATPAQLAALKKGREKLAKQNKK